MSDGATINVREAPGGATIEQDLGQTVSSDAVTVRGLTLGLKFDESRFRVKLTNPSPSAEAAPALSDGTGISYFQADAIGVPNDRIDEVTFRLRVTDDALPSGTSMDDIVLYRYSDGSWNALETTHEGDSVISATAPGFSTFAVGVPASDSTATVSTSTETSTQTATEQTTTATETNGADTGPETRTFTPGFGWIAALFALAVFALRAGRD